jgi:hypothetical protein
MQAKMQAIPEMLGIAIVERHTGVLGRRGNDPRVRSRGGKHWQANQQDHEGAT